MKLTEGTSICEEIGCARSGKVCEVKRCFRGSEHARLTHELNCAIITDNYCQPARRRICIHTTLDHGARLGSGTLHSQLGADRQRDEEPFPNSSLFWLFPHPASRRDTEPRPAAVRRQGATLQSNEGQRSPCIHSLKIRLCYRNVLLNQYQGIHS